MLRSSIWPFICRLARYCVTEGSQLSTADMNAPSCTDQTLILWKMSIIVPTSRPDYFARRQISRTHRGDSVKLQETLQLRLGLRPLSPASLCLGRIQFEFVNRRLKLVPVL